MAVVVLHLARILWRKDEELRLKVGSIVVYFISSRRSHGFDFDVLSGKRRLEISRAFELLIFRIGIRPPANFNKCTFFCV